MLILLLILLLLLLPLLLLPFLLLLLLPLLLLLLLLLFLAVNDPSFYYKHFILSQSLPSLSSHSPTCCSFPFFHLQCCW
jgi:hypothetical protein